MQRTIEVTISPTEHGILCDFFLPVSPDTGSTPDPHKSNRVRCLVEGFGPDNNPNTKARDVLLDVLVVVAESLAHFYDIEKRELTWEQTERLGVLRPK